MFVMLGVNIKNSMSPIEAYAKDLTDSLAEKLVMKHADNINSWKAVLLSQYSLKPL